MPNPKPLLALVAQRLFTSSICKTLQASKNSQARTFYSSKLKSFKDDPFIKSKHDITVTVELLDLYHDPKSPGRRADLNIRYCTNEDKFILTFSGHNYYFDIKEMVVKLQNAKIPFENNLRTTPYEISVSNAYNEEFSKFIHNISGALGLRTDGDKFIKGYSKVAEKEENIQSWSNCP